MPATLKRAYTGQPGTTDTLLYTVPASTRFRVREIHVVNTTGVIATITLGLHAAAALAAANHFLSALDIPAKGVYTGGEGQVLEAGETIRALQGTALALTVHISGVEVT